MALTWLLVSSLTGVIFAESLLPNIPPSALKSTLDPKRRNEVVDEAFLEQKDILLDMLESKLKDVRDKKKKKSDRSENNTEAGKCESLPGNVDLKLKSNGLSALGETDILMKFGNSGKGTLNLDASGISNVGKARLELAIGDGSIYVPGLNNLFVGKQYLNNCDKQNETETVVKEKHTQTLGNELLDYRRSGSDVNGDNSTNNDAANKGVNKDDQNNTETTNIDTNTTLNGNNTTTNFTVVELPTTVAIENDIMDRNNTTNPAAAAAVAAAEALGGGGRRAPPPLLRSRTLPAIIAPGFSILHAQIDPQRGNDITQSQMLCRGVSAHKVCGFRSQAPRISFTNKDEPDPHEARRKSASSRLGSSPRPSIASEDRGDGLVLRVPTPRGSVSSTGSSAGARLARLLTQGVRGTPEDVAMDAPRRLSWERRESLGQLPRSASIDSMVEAAICARHSEPQPTLQLPARTDRAFSLASPAVGRRAKTQRGQAGQ